VGGERKKGNVQVTVSPIRAGGTGGEGERGKKEKRKLGERGEKGDYQRFYFVRLHD